MIATIAKRQRWDTGEYQRIVSVRFREPNLHVAFANGDDIIVPTARFETAYLREQSPDWTRVALGPNGEVAAPGKNGVVGVPWDYLRLLTDPAFAADEEEQALATARRVGARLRALRGEQDWSEGEMATHAGVPLQIVEDVEAGRHPLDLRLHDRLLKAMGLDARALIVDQDEAR